MLAVTKLSNNPGDIDLTDVPIPEPSHGNVVVEVHATGICGTDLHIMKGEYKVVPPVVIGHEICGVVSEVGRGVDRAWIGKRVVMETFFATCGKCEHCRDGRPNLCLGRRSIGTHVNGGMTSFVEAPCANLHEAPEGISDYAASLAEPFACVCNALFPHGPAVGAGDRVLVIGPGAIGGAAAQVAKACGAEVVVRGASNDAERLDVLEKLGFACSVAGDDRIENDSFDVVIECSGNASGLADGLNGLRRRGRLLGVGLFGHPITVDFDRVCFKELVVTSGFASTPGSWRKTMSLIEGKHLNFEALVSEAVPLREWGRAFDSALSQKGFKYVMDPRLQ
jgi:L-iditol 2-dehydrogenase